MLTVTDISSVVDTLIDFLVSVQPTIFLPANNTSVGYVKNKSASTCTVIARYLDNPLDSISESNEEDVNKSFPAANFLH